MERKGILLQKAQQILRARLVGGRDFLEQRPVKRIRR